MKIGNPQSPSPGAPSDAARDPQTQRPESDQRDDAKGKRFGSALEKKASEKRGVEKRDSPGDPSQAMLPGQAMFAQPSFTTPVESAATGAVAGVLPPEISALSGEILHTLEVSGPNQIHIQFDASMLDGLSVTLTKEGGALAVNLQASSPEMARFLEVHAASLAQTLERPERAAFISIETRTHSGDRHGGQGRGGRQQDGRDEPERGFAEGDGR